MPSISTLELQVLSELFDEMVRLAGNIKLQAPPCKEGCEKIELCGHHALLLLNDVRVRGESS